MPYHRDPDPWRWPADSPVERAQRVARSYREALLTVDPVRCHALDAEMIRLGQRWVRAVKAEELDLEELLTVREAADLCQVLPSTIAQWRRRGLRVTGTDMGPRYRVRDLVDYRTRLRLRRIRGKRSC